ncbi:MAG: fasciclin domain-containing protein [Phycisphaerae bacterium]
MTNIRKSLLPVLAVAAAALSVGCNGGTKPKMDVVETAVSAKDFTTLVTAVQAADLASTLKGEGPYTVFAPTDAAFDRLPEGTLGDLLKPENKQKLQAILKYHVVHGDLDAKEVMSRSSVQTLQGSEADISVSGGQVFINEAKIIRPDMRASNGRIHVIDMVILPEP